jgi:hypothetical protein
MKRIYQTGLLLTMLLAACGQNRTKATIGNSQDTTSVNKAGGPPIRDTATINKDRLDSAKGQAKPGAAKGNADPSGRIKNQ